MQYTNYNGYLVAGGLKSDNAGFSKWGIGTKDGKEYFVKEFLSPVYPQNAEMFSATQLEKRKKFCANYEAQKTLLYKTINEASDGNAVRITDFFRCEGHYYIVMPRVNATSFSPAEICKITDWNYFQLKLICKTLAHSIYTLHSQGIVHGDIKWDNILLEKSPVGWYVAKTIDFDNSFFESEPPKNPDDFNFDIVYLSPEGFLFQAGEDVKIGKPLDVFALGVYFHLLFQGELPKFASGSSYDYVFQGLLEGDTLVIGDKVPPEMVPIIRGMLETDPVKRFTLKMVVDMLAGRSAEASSEKPAEKATKNDHAASVRINTWKKESSRFKSAGNLL